MGRSTRESANRPIAQRDALIALFIIAAPAHAWDRQAGIDKARIAGVKIGPRAERVMARAPRGSCANHPTHVECPPIHAVRIAEKHSRLAHVLLPQCAVRLGETPSSPYKAAGYAQAAPGGTTIHASARYHCESGAYRAWHARAEGYAVLEGTLYMEAQDRYHNLNCS
jgi:hypothetical protein